jgi:hypothetical protein
MTISDQAMNNLALSYSALGRNQEALELRENVLKYREQALSGNILSIGDIF